MAISRIGGRALKANLERDSNLAFDTDTLVVDYINRKVVINGISYPTSDGTVNQVLTTDGLGNLTFTDAGGNTGMDITLGTPSDSSLYPPGAIADWTESTFVTDAIDDLNEILGLLVPTAPPTWPDGDAIADVSSDATFQLANGAVTDNTTDGLPAAGSNVNTIFSSGVTTDLVGLSGDSGSGPGKSGSTITGLLNGSSVGSVALTDGDDSGTYTSLVITQNADYPADTPGFYRMVQARISGATALAGYNKVQITHSGANNSNQYYFVYDDQLSGVGTTASQTIVDPGGLTTNDSSSVPHYTNGQNLDVSATLNNLSGLTYRKSAAVTVSGTSATGDGVVLQTTNFDIGATGMPADPLIVNDATASATNLDVATADNHASGVAQIRFRNPIGGSFSTISGTTILVMGSTATTAAIDEDNINTSGISGLVSFSGSTNAKRVDMTGDAAANTPSATYTATTANWNSSATLQTFDATVVGGQLQHDQTNYSTGYLPAGPNLSGQTGGTQYATFMFRASPLSKFDIRLTASAVAGIWIKIPGVSDDSTTNNYWDGVSSDNGWWDMSTAYAGAGVPGTGTGANGSTGCALAGNVPTGSSISNQTFTCTLGSESTSNATNNIVLVRIGIASGQNVSALAFEAASN